jgi:hypothetical protein
MKKYLRSFITDKRDRMVLWQKPNPPLLVWLGLTIISHLIRSGRMHDIAKWSASSALLYWAYLEIKDGASPFRRTLGIVVFVWIVIQVIRAFLA